MFSRTYTQSCNKPFVFKIPRGTQTTVLASCQLLIASRYLLEETMTQHESCRHVKEDGAYCGSPALRDRKYCYYHLAQRGRRLRRARALRDNVPYRLEIQSLDNPYAIRNALTDIAQALAAGQLDARVAGKLLYAIQQVSSANRRIEQMEAAAAAKESNSDDRPRLQEYPEFEQQFGIPPGTDLDAEIDAVLRKADEEAQLRQAEAMPTPPPGVRVGSPAYRVYREEAYQMMRLQLLDMRHQLRDYNQQKRQQFETIKKEVTSAFPTPEAKLVG